MANCKLILRLFLVFICLWLTFYFLRTNLEEYNAVANLTGSLYFCSQASRLISPVMKLPMPPLPRNPTLLMNDESVAVKCVSQPFPSVSNVPTVYIGCRSSNLNSPITDINRRLSPLTSSSGPFSCLDVPLSSISELRHGIVGAKHSLCLQPSF